VERGNKEKGKKNQRKKRLDSCKHSLKGARAQYDRLGLREKRGAGKGKAPIRLSDQAPRRKKKSAYASATGPASKKKGGGGKKKQAWGKDPVRVPGFWARERKGAGTFALSRESEERGRGLE